MSVLGTILSSGRSSRFYEAIVRQKQLSTGVFARSDDSRGPGLFSITATALPGKTLTELEAAIDEEVERVKSGPLQQWEIEKARTAARRTAVAQLRSSLNRAVTLGEDALFYNDPNRINTRAERIASVNAADVQRVARQYLVKTGRSVVLTVPKPSAPKGGH
jgi:zinc protease